MRKNSSKKLSRTTKIVLKEILDFGNPIKSEDLVNNLNINLRTIRYAIKKLCDLTLIERVPNFADLRCFYYIPSKSAKYKRI